MEEQIIVQTFDEIITVNDPSKYTNLNLGKQNVRDNWQLIAGGQIGQVFAQSQGDFVIKKMSLCAFGPGARHCKLATTNTIIFTIKRPLTQPVGDVHAIQFMEIPDFLMEPFIGASINVGLQSNNLIGVPILKDSAIDYGTNDSAMYLLIEKLNPLPQMRPIVDIAYRMWQIMTNLYFMQNFLRFTHYDLHWGNIMSKELDAICIQYGPQLLNSSVQAQTWPVISDFGTAIFSKMEGNTRVQYMNTTNNLHQPKLWNEYNQHFDGLTLLKSLDMYFRNEYQETLSILTDSRFSSLVQCFIHPGENPSQYFDGPNAYRPNIENILANPGGLFSTYEVIGNLLQTFTPQRGKFKDIIIDSQGVGCNTVVGSRTVGAIGPGHFIQIDPIVPINELPEIPFSEHKCYFMDFGPPLLRNPNGSTCSEKIPNGIEPINITVIREVMISKIFSFSLFGSERYLKQVYRWFFDPDYDHPADGGQLGKASPDAFFTHYLGNQIKECIHLINDTMGHYGTPYYRPLIQNQWTDFGTLMIVDKNVLQLPMMIQDGNQLQPWSKTTHVVDPCDPQRRVRVTARVNSFNNSERQAHGIKKVLDHYNWGTVLDYILWRVDQEISADQRFRFGLYEYNVTPTFETEMKIPVNNSGVIEERSLGFVNTVGLLGSVIRFTVLQDPHFVCVLFRDAHSTMPNRNFPYDRQWYNTWQTQTNNRIWTYHGAFYNPPHGDGQKIAFAATWGVCKRNQSYSIFSRDDYAKAFGIHEVSKTYYTRPEYGVDERLMFRLTTMPVWLNDTYFVGIIHKIYLIAGQMNPRTFRLWYDSENGSRSPSDFNGYDDTKDMIKIANQHTGKNRILIQDYITTAERNNADAKLKKFAENMESKGFHVGHSVSLDSNTFAVIVNNVEDDTPLTRSVTTYNTQNGTNIQLGTMKEFKSEFITGSVYMCRKLDFMMPDMSFYTDMRCVYMSSISQFAAEIAVDPMAITESQYYDRLDMYLSNQIQPPKMMQVLIQMLPPRWNTWNYLFCDNSSPRTSFDTSNDAIYPTYVAGINTKTICSINKLLWTGNVFNADQYFYGNATQLPPQNVLPATYPK